MPGILNTQQIKEQDNLSQDDHAGRRREGLRSARKGSQRAQFGFDSPRYRKVHIRSRGRPSKQGRREVFNHKAARISGGGGLAIPSSEMRLKASLRVKFADRRTATAVNSALLPDNVDLPEGMSIHQKVSGSLLEIEVNISGTSTRVETLISTLDEFVAHIYSVTQTLEKIESLHDRHKDSERKS